MTTYTITANEAFNSLEISFNEKPAESIREALKALKFRWHAVKKIWYGFADRETVEKALKGEQITAEPTATKTAKKAAGTPQNHIKFYYNGLKVDGGDLVKVYYYIRENQTICISARDYDNLPRDLFDVENDTDYYTDYFDNDSAEVTPDHPLYKYIRYNAIKARIKDAERTIKYNEKEMKRGEVWRGFLASRQEKINSAKATIEKYKNEPDPGQPTAEDLEQINRARQEAENKRREEEHAAELAERERVLNARCNGHRYIESVAAEHPITDGAPVVLIHWSEHPAFYSWGDDELKLSLAAADIVLEHYDTERANENAANGCGGYDKTKFTIYYTDENGEPGEYGGRYDLGDNEHGLIQHIRNFGEWYLTHDQFGHLKEQPDTENEVTRFADYLEQFKADEASEGGEVVNLAAYR